ncbi:MAG: S-methyl-5'-thioadenosine phosphorylase [Deltaproteobacteria bacterium]|nr:S-methyl-5'-thioadenosine phosphorylase [Deltaproteobacteria bacterium]
MAQPVIGVIGGTGLYDMPDLTAVERIEVETPFGPPSDAIVRGTLAGRTVCFVPRHGVGHRLMPSEVPYRANIFALKKLGVERILSLSAVGSLRQEIRPGDIIVVDQFIDRTRQRRSTFFGDGLVGHIQFADPVCPHLHDVVVLAAQQAGSHVHAGGTYVCIEGPAFSTRAESHIYRGWGAAVIGMTNLTEAKLAREAEICYTTIALATDYDCWHESEEDVSIDAIMAVLQRNVAMSQQIIRLAVPMIQASRGCLCARAAETAIITARDRIPDQRKQALAPLFGKYL